MSSSTIFSQPANTRVYNQPAVSTYLSTAPVETRVVHPVQQTQASAVRISAVPQATGTYETTSSFSRPPNPTFYNGFTVPKTNIAFISNFFIYIDRPATSINLASQNISTFQQPPIQKTQKPLLVQNTSQLPTHYSPPAPRQVSNPPSTTFLPQQVALGNATSAVSQAPITAYNQPLQFVESISINQTRDDRFQPQRAVSQTIESKDVGKVFETGAK